MSFGRVRYPRLFMYEMEGTTVLRVQSVKDLGVIFDAKLTFHDHINTIAVESFQRLGFVLRNCRDFHNPFVITLLYYAIVRSKLEASACVWHPYQKKYALILEKVQKAFLRYLYKRVYGYYPYMYPTKYLLGCLGFNSLAVRRNNDQLKVMCKILRGDIEAPDLHSKLFQIVVPSSNLRLRRNRVFAIAPHHTVARAMAPIPRSLSSFNALLDKYPQWDPFNDNWSQIKLCILKFSENIN